MSNIGHLATMQWPAWKLWVLAFMCIPFDIHPLMAAAHSAGQCTLTHHKSCLGTARGTWQRAQGVDQASKLPWSQSGQVSVVCAGSKLSVLSCLSVSALPELCLSVFCFVIVHWMILLLQAFKVFCVYVVDEPALGLRLKFSSYAKSGTFTLMLNASMLMNVHYPN